MRVLDGYEKERAEEYMREALKECEKSLCLSSQCGTIIVNNGLVVGKGFNSPPQNVCLEKCVKDDLPSNFRSDETCCVHAEQRAILDAIAMGAPLLKGAMLFFVRKKNGEKVFAGKPYCTICSKLALDVGIKEFVLWHENGITTYDTNEYNQLSFAFRPE